MSGVDPLGALAASTPEEQDEREALRRALVMTQRQLARARVKVDDLVAATIEAATSAALALGRTETVPAPKLKTSKAKEEVALLVTSDWQGAKVTPTYNSDVMERRVKQFVDKACMLTELHRAGVPVTDCVLVMGGDMLEGLFNFPTQVHEIDATLFEQLFRVARIIVEIVRRLLKVFRTVQVVAEWGNHGRIGSKRDAVPRSDNLDRMAYEVARQQLLSEPRVIWPEASGEDVQLLVVGNYRAVVMHGDEIGRTGFAAPGTIVQHVNKWRSGAFRVNGEPWEFRDAYIHHYHTHAEWPMANGEGTVFQTGSTESDNRYAAIGLASSALPSQRLHFIDPRKGWVTSQAKVRLDI